MSTILILGAGGTAAHNFIKCLHKIDYLQRPRIIGADLNQYHLEASCVDVKYSFPEKCDFVTEVNNIIEKEKVGFVYAAPDPLVWKLARNRNEINAKTFLPSDRTISICHDKFRTAQLLGNLAPRTEEIDFFSEELCSVVCLYQSYEGQQKWWLRMRRGAGSKAALPVSSSEQATNWIEYWVNFKGAFPADFIVCEYLPGREFAWQGLYHNGKLITSFARERLEYVFGHLTPSGQSSSPSIARSVNDSAVNSFGHKCVTTIDPEPHGVFGVDIKANYQNELKCTEINVGRFYTTSLFPAACGLNMPWIYLSLGLNRKPPKALQYNHIKENLFWIRSIDKEPYLWTQNETG